MKKRIKIDSSILSFIIILTGVLYQFPHLYSTNQFLDNVMDFIGIITVLKGVYWRMSARGHKKAHSQKGAGLVTSGLYKYTRNPMYLGTFLIGAGFVLIVWPWWVLPVFAGLFYLRFKRQVVHEEEHLIKLFGKSYETYCRKVPRVFPAWSSYKKIKTKESFNWEETWSTKEKRNLVFLPLGAVLLETLQEKIVFDIVNLQQTIAIFSSAIVVFAVVLWARYR